MNQIEEDAQQTLRYTVALLMAVNEEPGRNAEITIEIEKRSASIEWKEGDLTVEKEKMMSRLQRQLEEEFKCSDKNDVEEFVNDRTGFKEKKEEEPESSGESGSSSLKNTILNS